MSELTKAEFLERYGSVEVVFTDYYKYTFNFVGNLPDGKTVCVRVGGTSADIYREVVVAGRKQRIDVLFVYAGTVRDGNAVIESFYEME